MAAAIEPMYHYIIIGAGAAGLHLATQMARDAYFSDQPILIIEKDEKDSDDRTWSFWEKGPSRMDQVTYKSWDNGVFYSDTQKLDLNPYPYSYKTIRSSDFYAYSKRVLSKAEHIQWTKDQVIEVRGQEVIGKKGTYKATHIFDSRVPDAFEKNQHKYSSLIQHFKGWYIKTPQPAFNPDAFVMMDYRLPWQDQTAFMYVLPFSDKEALVEYTLFNTYLLSDKDYDHQLKIYISDFLKISTYEVIEEEKGMIPMSDYPFHKHHTAHATKIGTAGGWVRPSTGYSFRNARSYSRKVIQNIKAGRQPSKGVATGRFRWYDSIFLEVLKSKNHLGPSLFHKLYTKNQLPGIFRFLDENSRWMEDLSIMLSLYHFEFIKALLKKTVGRAFYKRGG